ncbi:MAG TPA: hypothetical protein VFW96_05295, partial [Thermomicrobiales bacterium]|nr:hypothetical protein [Thermomicrobiales bacterium]
MSAAHGIGLGLGRYVLLPLMLAWWSLCWPAAVAGAAPTRLPARHAVLRLAGHRRVSVREEGADLPDGSAPRGDASGAPTRWAGWRQDAAILMYHRVADGAPPAMAVSPRHFRQQM